MRPSLLIYILVGVPIFASYQILNQPRFPNLPSDQFDGSRQSKSDPPPIYKDESRSQDGDVVPADLNTEESTAKDEARLDANQPSTDQSSRTAKDEAQPDGNLLAINRSSAPKDAKQNLSYLAYYAYSEVPPETKPADTVHKSLEDTPRGTPVEEIKRVADAFGLDFNFMKAVAKVESDFNPKERTGSYIGLFQLSKAEFQQYGSGDILDPRDNAVAAAYKFLTEDILFEISTHKKPSLNDIYLVHQQGWQGAAEHVSHSDRLAWKSMCATDEGRAKGEKWCKRAIWGNTLPAIKHIWKTVDNVTSGAFVGMWQQRVSHFYSRYYEATAK
jgi:transglycosylase-like protein with SLT domain